MGLARMAHRCSHLCYPAFTANTVPSLPGTAAAAATAAAGEAEEGGEGKTTEGTGLGEGDTTGAKDISNEVRWAGKGRGATPTASSWRGASCGSSVVALCCTICLGHAAALLMYTCTPGS